MIRGLLVCGEPRRFRERFRGVVRMTENGNIHGSICFLTFVGEATRIIIIGGKDAICIGKIMKIYINKQSKTTFIKRLVKICKKLVKIQ